MTFTVRDMQPQDIQACVKIVNAIIAVGGSTAYENPYTESDFDEHYRLEPAISKVVLSGGRVVGFQACFEIEPGIYSIGSFTDRESPVRGAGKAIFEGTLAAARAKGTTVILAKITSDNTGGLAYYTKMGFVDHEVIKNDLSRRNGVTVDRIIKRFEL